MMKVFILWGHFRIAYKKGVDMSQIDNDKLKDFLIKAYSFDSYHETGYMLLDKNYNILFANSLCQEYFRLRHVRQPNSVELFQKLNKSALKPINRRIYDHNLLLQINNHLTGRIHEVVKTQLTPIQFIFFILYCDEYKSLQVHFVPVSGSDGVEFIQVFISDYDTWGIGRSIGMVLNGDSEIKSEEYLKIMNKTNRPDIPLTTRQEEIVFLLALNFNLGLREIAKILKISYGSLAVTLKSLIFPKFNVPLETSTQDFINILRSYGYHNLIPQSLCRPMVTILDLKLREKFFSLSHAKLATE